MTSLADLRLALSHHRPRKLPLASWFSTAAVAAIAHDSDRGAELLFIRRSQRKGDPWSGHMAFPGGRVDAGDASDSGQAPRHGLGAGTSPRSARLAAAFAAALRETREEISLDLAGQPLLGRLSPVPTKAHGKLRPMVIEPFVFELNAIPTFTFSPEVEQVIWVPVDFFRNAANRGSLDWKLLKLPCYRFEDCVIWGLTLRMVDELTSLMAP